jgi:hypothetical protein
MGRALLVLPVLQDFADSLRDGVCVQGMTCITSSAGCVQQVVLCASDLQCARSDWCRPVLTCVGNPTGQQRHDTSCITLGTVAALTRCAWAAAVDRR